MGRIIILGSKGEPILQLKRDIGSMRHSVAIADFDDAAEAVRMRKPDLILVDLTLHGAIVEIWQLLRYHIENSHIPTVVLVSRDRVREVELLVGVNDFIVYPYDSRELEVRMKLILKQQESIDAGDIIKTGNLAIDPAKYEVTVGGWPVVLTLKEYELLKYLATRKGRVITRENLLDQIWGYDYYGGARTVDVHIGRLRAKIETGKYSFIKTVRGVGYAFTDEYSTN